MSTIDLLLVIYVLTGCAVAFTYSLATPWMTRTIVIMAKLSRQARAGSEAQLNGGTPEELMLSMHRDDARPRTFTDRLNSMNSNAGIIMVWPVYVAILLTLLVSSRAVRRGATTREIERAESAVDTMLGASDKAPNGLGEGGELGVERQELVESIFAGSTRAPAALEIAASREVHAHIDVIVNRLMFLDAADEALFAHFREICKEALAKLPGEPLTYHENPVSMVYGVPGKSPVTWMFRGGRKQLVSTFGDHGDLFFLIRLNVANNAQESADCEFRYWPGAHGIAETPAWMFDLDSQHDDAPPIIRLMVSNGASPEFQAAVVGVVRDIKEALIKDNTSGWVLPGGPINVAEGTVIPGG